MPRFTREEAQALVWETPLSTLAQRFETTPAILRRSLIYNGIALPSAGHRGRQKASKTVPRPSIPPRGPGEPWSVWLGPSSHGHWASDPAEILAEPEPMEPIFPETIERMEPRIAQRIGKVRALKSLTEAHPAIANYLEADEKIRKARRLSAYFSSLHETKFDSAFEKRRFRILNSLFLALQKSGARPSVSGDAARSISVQVGCASVSLQLDHPDAKPNRQGEWRVRDGWADLLKLTLNRSPSSQTWADAEETALEDHLTEIAGAVLVAGEVSYREGEHARYRSELGKRETARKQLAERQVEAERKAHAAEVARLQQMRTELLQMARDHEDARLIRAFVAAVDERRLVKQDLAADEWREWALKCADAIDPLRIDDLNFGKFRMEHQFKSDE